MDAFLCSADRDGFGVSSVDEAAMQNTDPFGYMECLCLSTPNICSEKNVFRYIVS